MSKLIFGMVAAGILLVALTLHRGAGTRVTAHSALPTEANAKTVMNTTRHHREWVNVPYGASGIRAYIVYPERPDKAPVVILAADEQGASDWVRAVGVQAAEEGYIAVVPDVLSSQAPHGGDGDSFGGPEETRRALDRLGRNEAARRANAVRQYALALPASNGKSADLDFHFSRGGNLESVSATSEQAANSAAGENAWAQAVAFLNQQTNNVPVAGVNPNLPEDHSAHIMMAMGQTPNNNQGTVGGRGYPTGKFPNLPAGVFTAKNAVAQSKLRKEFVDIPLDNLKLHAWVEYPEGNEKAPLLVVMQHGPGLDDWQRALADQLASEGFIAVAADLYSGLGPNGGNYDSFFGTDDAMRSAARLTPEEAIRRYKAAWQYGMKLPRANGKSATVGFCAGGTYSFRFAGEVQEINGAVVFYGTQPTDEIMAKIKAPVLGFYGDDDARVTTTVEPAVAAMKKSGKAYEPHIYPHATHGFLEFQDLGGNPAATSDSWARTIAFLNQHTR